MITLFKELGYISGNKSPTLTLYVRKNKNTIKIFTYVNVLRGENKYKAKRKCHDY